MTLNKQLPRTVVWASLPVQLSNTSVQLVWRESEKQLSTTPLNSFKRGKSWQRPCIEIQHVKKVVNGIMVFNLDDTMELAAFSWCWGLAGEKWGLGWGRVGSLCHLVEPWHLDVLQQLYISFAIFLSLETACIANGCNELLPSWHFCYCILWVTSSCLPNICEILAELLGFNFFLVFIDNYYDLVHWRHSAASWISKHTIFMCNYVKMLCA